MRSDGYDAVMSRISILADLRVFCANFGSEKMGLCYFLHFLHVCMMMKIIMMLTKNGLRVLGSDCPCGAKVAPAFTLDITSIIFKVKKIYFCFCFRCCCCY